MLFYFALTLLVSSSLLFLVQPMIGKMILPHLGGTPAVWNTCMVFFQGVLLIGYAYTHTVSGWRNRRVQLVTHIVLIALPLLVLPFTLGDWKQPQQGVEWSTDGAEGGGAGSPIFAVLLLLLGMVGLPFFVVATSAPLLQKWFTGTGHPAAKDPYFLYGASNLGSMVAVLAYPVFVEPNFGVDEQTWLWTVGYALLAVLVVGCAGLVWSSPVQAILVESSAASAAPAPAQPMATSVRPGKPKRAWRPATVPLAAALTSPSRAMTLARRLRWIGLAAAPSSLMLGVTTYLTTDIAAIPLFWVIPLALYLLTFILVFSRWPVRWTGLPHTIVLYVQPFVLMALVLIVVAGLRFPEWTLFLIHLGVFFSMSLVCHGELAKDRPEPRHLTEFYLWMSVGGVLGGMLNALVAPPLFWFGVVEYPLAMLLACALRPNMIGPAVLIPGDTDAHRQTPLGIALDLLLPLGLGLLMFRMVHVPMSSWLRPVLIALPIVLCLGFIGRPMRFALSLAAFMLAVTVHDRSQETNVIFEDRSFFGLIKVRMDRYVDEGPIYHVLMHGGINHGAQHREPSLRRKAITYFYPTSGVGQVFERLKWPDARLPSSLVGLGASPLSPMPSLLTGVHSEPPFAVIGLGIGTLASHGRPFQHVRFLEIDPAVVELSLPRGEKEPYFTYLQDALDRGTDLKVILGDGRLTLRDMKQNDVPYDHYYHVLVIDAFSSDAIPVHLLTREAIALYLKRLTPGGVLIFNTTNRYVDLRPVLADLAAEKNLLCLYYGDHDDSTHQDKFGSDWVVLQRQPYATLKTKEEVDGYMLAHPDFSGPLPLVQGLNLENWDMLPAQGRPIWTDAYSNLFRAMNLWRD